METIVVGYILIGMVMYVLAALYELIAINKMDISTFKPKGAFKVFVLFVAFWPWALPLYVAEQLNLI